MKHLSFCIALALVFLLGCSKEPQMANLSDESLSIQASSTSYDPYSEQSVVLNAHATYGPMILNDPNVDLLIGIGSGVAWGGPWVDGCGPYPYNPDVIGHCRGQNTVCFVIIEAASAVADIFQGEGLSISNYSNPAILIRPYMDHSNMVLVDNFNNSNSTGLHQADVIKALQ